MPGQRFTFGPFVLDADAGTVSRKGMPLAAGYRAVRLLVELARQAPDVVTKAELMDAVWPGMAVEEGNLTVQVAAVRKLLGSAPEGGEWIATIPRVGYRFGHRVELAGEVRGNVDQGEARRTESGLSIAVLPFINLSGDAEQEYFADGLTEDITTALARLRALFVTARNSSFTYKGRVVDVKQVGRELGVRYLLQGSVRRSGQHVRVSAELADTNSGSQLWAARYDAELSDFLALQDQITESVVATIEPQLYAAENLRVRNKPAESLDAWGFVMRAMPLVWVWGSAEEIGRAEALLKRATDIDPNYARANSLLAWTLGARAHLGWEYSNDVLAEALKAANRAIAEDPDDPWGHLSAGYVHMVSRRFKPAVDELTEAIDRNPSFAHAHTLLGCAYAYGGLPEEGIRECTLAQRISPRDYAQAPGLSSIGLCHLLRGSFAEAVEFEQRAIQLRPHFGTAWRTLAAAAGLAGDRETAASALTEAKRLQPSLTIDWVEMYHPIVREKDRALYIEGLRAAGLE